MNNSLDYLLKKTSILIENEHYTDAINLLKEESNNPLYTLKEQEIINRKINDLNKFNKQLNIFNKYNNANKNQLIDFFNKDNYNPTILDLLFDKFKDNLTKNDFEQLGKIFTDNSVTNKSKINVLQILKSNEIDYSYNFHNALTNKTFIIKTNDKIDIFNCSETLFKVSDQLYALYFHEISKDTVAKQIINAIYYYYFGSFEYLPYKYEKLLNNIIDYIDNSFNNIEQKNIEFVKWISNILSHN